MTESTLQAYIYGYFNNTYCLKHHSPRSLILSIPNGGTRNVREAMLLKATGVYPGASDLLLLHRGVCLFIELKTETGVQSDKQKNFQDHVESCGFKYYLVRSLDEFKELIGTM